MARVFLAEKELELVIKERAISSLEHLEIHTVSVEAMIERNPDVLMEASEYEPVVISEFISLVLYKENNQLILNNVYGMERIVE